jgi:hypothetical protein
MVSSQNPSPPPLSRRDELKAMLRHGGAMTDEIADLVIRNHRHEVLNEAIEAGRGEYLADATGTPEDEAYNQAVSDVVAAIGALLEGGAR